MPGRQITNNIMIAQEGNYSMHKMKRRKGVMTIKVDLERAYDRLKWDFIQETLIGARLPKMFVEIIMKCIKIASLSILWNDIPSSKFLPARGITQGDLLYIPVYFCFIPGKAFLNDK